MHRVVDSLSFHLLPRNSDCLTNASIAALSSGLCELKVDCLRVDSFVSTDIYYQVRLSGGFRDRERNKT